MGFEFVDDFHGADFGGASDAAAGKAGGEGGEVGLAIAEAAGDGGDEMLDLGVTLEAGQFGDVDGAVFADFAEVVAEEVGDHDEFGHFFGAGLKLVAELGVTGGVGGAGAGAFDGAGLDVGAAEAQKGFGEEEQI